MDDHSFMTQVEVFSVTDSGRRLCWSTAEKIRIVEERLSRPRMAASAARRYDLSRRLLTWWRKGFRAGLPGSRRLLTRWRKGFRAGLLGCGCSTRFAPVMIAPEPAPARPEPPVAPPSADTMGIVLVNGRRLTVSPTIDPALLARLLAVLDGA